VAALGAVSGLQIVRDLLQAYVVVLFVRAVISWFPMEPGSPLVPLARVLDRLTEPVLAPIRRILPPVRAGGMAIDLSIIVAIVAVEILARLI
jgi:YggT family protein